MLVCISENTTECLEMGSLVSLDGDGFACQRVASVMLWNVTGSELAEIGNADFSFLAQLT